MIAFFVHCALILAFAILGGIFYEIPVSIFAIVYSGLLVAAYSVLLHRFKTDSRSVGKTLVVIHLAASISLVAVGVVAEKVIPVVGSAMSYVSIMSFYILNYPGLPISKLLPYPGDPELIWSALSDTVIISATAAWLYLALFLGNMFSTKGLNNA